MGTSLGSRSVVLTIGRAEDGSIDVELRDDDRVVASASGGWLRREDAQLGAFIRRRGRRQGAGWSESERRLVGADLVELGERLGDVVFPGPVGVELVAMLGQLADDAVLDLVVDADGDLVALPVEAARPAALGRRVMALEPKVQLRRHPRGVTRAAQPALAHPLKVLVAVVAPDQEDRPLDRERELEAILTTLDDPAAARAEVRILEAASLERIGGALEIDDYHVVHLSGHGKPGRIALEDGHGATVSVDGPTLAGVLCRGRRPVPLVVLSACDSATRSSGMVDLAGTLVTHGIDRVVAMQATVTDLYTSGLARGLYGRLAEPGRVTVGAALAATRRELEAAQVRGPTAPWSRGEYAIPTLVTAGDDAPLVDWAGAAVALRERPVHDVHPLLPQLGQNDLGRRRERRAALATLREDARPVAIVGGPGTGKSALAGRVAARMAEDGWALAVVAGPLCRDALVSAVADGLDAWAARRDEAAGRTGVPPDPVVSLARVRAERLRVEVGAARDQMLSEVLRRHPVLVVVDGLDRDMTLGGERFVDKDVLRCFRMLARKRERSRLLVTSRYELPFPHSMWRGVLLGELFPADIGKLFRRHPGLDALDPDEAARVLVALGGHPGVLELLAGLLGCETDRQDEPARPPALGVAGAVPLDDPARALDTAIAQAVELAARDFDLDVHLDLLDPDERDLLIHAAPSAGVPVSTEDLAAVTGRSPRRVRAALGRLRHMGLLLQVDEGQDIVCRWTARALATREPVAHRAACRALADRRLAQSADEPLLAVAAVYNLVAGQWWDDAATRVVALYEDLRDGHPTLVATITAVVLNELPTDHPAHGTISVLRASAEVATAEDLDRARRLVRRLLEAPEADPDGAFWRHRLATAYEDLADVTEPVGQTDEAIRCGTRALEIRRALADGAPDDTACRQRVARASGRLGVLLALVGRNEEALRLHTEALDAVRRTAAAHPDDESHLRDLSLACGRLATELQTAGWRAESARLYGEALDIDRRLADAEPDSVARQRIVAESCAGLGRAMRELVRTDEALRLGQEALDIRRRLTDAQPDRADLKADLATSHTDVGHLLWEAGTLRKASDLHSGALDIRHRLADAEPHRTDHQHELAKALSEVGDVAFLTGSRLIEVGRPAEVPWLYSKAVDGHTQALDIARRLADAEPDRTDYQRTLSVGYERLWLLARDAGDTAAAEDHLRRCVAINERLLDAVPGRADAGVKLLRLAEVVDDPDALRRQVIDVLEPLDADDRLDARERRVLNEARELVQGRGQPPGQSSNASGGGQAQTRLRSP